KLKLSPDVPTAPEKTVVKWCLPVTETFCYWGPNVGTCRHLAPAWGPRMTSSRLASGAPVHSLISADGTNRLTIAVSDAATPLDITTGSREDSAETECRVIFFTLPCAPLSHYEATIRLDMRRINWCDALRDAASWWENDCGYKPCPVPELAKQPMNSLWYSYHQYLKRDEIREQCALSVPYGMKTVIIDDGWQTADKGGYSHCGDWAPVGLPDIKETVEDIHALGMKIILWYSVPFIGIYSDNYERFKDMTLYGLFDDTTYCLDPRYPEVREYLIDIYKRAMTEWDLDGMKLDFIDSFCPGDRSNLPDDRRDYVSIDEAVDALMTQTYNALTAIKPDALIEFRQSYIGPAIRKFGNMLRVGDCPCDPMSNRRAIIDLRLISGDTAVHSDMLMWNKTDTPESVALQLGSILFAVPQISVRLHELTDEHKKLLTHYLNFWTAHRDVLLGGKLYAKDPGVLYSSAYAEKDGEAVWVSYEDPVVRKVADATSVVNCSAKEALIFEGFAGMSYRVVTCTGDGADVGAFSSDLEKISVPAGGMVFID
ncbi:MAG: alpha-galactosidase, partial [Clostridia bacterium]|nr:alpha-galactosidase [Clostridia bacterium]